MYLQPTEDRQGRTMGLGKILAIPFRLYKALQVLFLMAPYCSQRTIDGLSATQP
jgi:hypothetical protein